MTRANVASLLGGVMIFVWAVFWLPGWIIAMLWADELILLPPPDAAGIKWALYFLADYVVPIVGAGLLWLGFQQSK